MRDITDKVEMERLLREAMADPKRVFFCAVHSIKNVGRTPNEEPHPGGHIIEGARVGSAYTPEGGETVFHFVYLSGQYGKAVSFSPVAQFTLNQIEKIQIL